MTRGPEDLNPGLCTAVLMHGLKFNTRDLRRYAHRVVHVFRETSVWPDNSEVWEKFMSDILREFLTNKFDPKNHYVVLGGCPIMSAAFHREAGALGLSYTVLRFDSKEGAYWPYRMGMKDDTGRQNQLPAEQ